MANNHTIQSDCSKTLIVFIYGDNLTAGPIHGTGRVIVIDSCIIPHCFVLFDDGRGSGIERMEWKPYTQKLRFLNLRLWTH